MGNFLTWGVVGILATIAVSAGVVAYWFDPERPARVAEKRRKRRAKANQKWVRDAVKRHGGDVMASSIDREAETRVLGVIERFNQQLEDPWKHLESK
jgi:hypothetical protein